MFRAKGTPKTYEGHMDMSFRDTEGWYAFKEFGFVFNLIKIGDEQAGPMFSMLNAFPGAKMPVSAAHAHASDSFRVALKGHIHMDPKAYEALEFRYQEGWRVYPGHGDVVIDDHGMWEIVLLGDSRGQKARSAVKIEGPDVDNELLKVIAADFEMVGDVMSDDPADGAGPSAITTTLAPRPRMGKLEGSYANSTQWDEVAPGVRATIALIGDAQKGPVVICTDVAPNACAMPHSRFGTEVLRVVVDGDSEIGEFTYQMGDVRVQMPDMPCDDVMAGDRGLKELIVLGDRRHLAIEAGSSAWPSSISGYVDSLRQNLAERIPAAAVG